VAGVAPFDGRLSGDRAIAALAARQHGVISLEQLEELGLTAGAVKHRIGAGRLHRLHVGVYAVGHRALSGRGHRLAAVLACGRDAVLSHRDGAALWEVRFTARTRIDVTVPRAHARSQPGIDVHRVRSLHPEDCTVRDGIPVTTVARTLLDLAEVVRPREVERAFDEAERLGLLDLVALEAVCRRARGRRGLKVLRPLVADRRPSMQDTRSPLERIFLPFCRDHGIPLPATNVEVAGLLVDAVWPAQRLIVELDGYEFHGKTRSAFEADRVRDATLQLAGYRVVRITWRRLEREPDAVASLLHELLRR
jgi:Transcriptional regulator, AbiEi antitoxin/Protein of unknown function (DUF559)